MANKDTEKAPSGGSPKQRRSILKMLPRLILGLLSVVVGILFFVNSDLFSSFFMYAAVYVFGGLFFIPGIFFLLLGIYVIFRTVFPPKDEMTKEEKKGLILDIVSFILLIFCIAVLMSAGLPDSVDSLQGETFSLNVSQLNSYYGTQILKCAPNGLHVTLPQEISNAGGGYLSVLAVGICVSIGMGKLGAIIMFAILGALFFCVLLRHPIRQLSRALAYARVQFSSTNALAPKRQESRFRQSKAEKEAKEAKGSTEKATAEKVQVNPAAVPASSAPASAADKNEAAPVAEQPEENPLDDLTQEEKYSFGENANHFIAPDNPVSEEEGPQPIPEIVVSEDEEKESEASEKASASEAQPMAEVKEVIESAAPETEAPSPAPVSEKIPEVPAVPVSPEAEETAAQSSSETPEAPIAPAEETAKDETSVSPAAPSDEVSQPVESEESPIMIPVFPDAEQSEAEEADDQEETQASVKADSAQPIQEKTSETSLADRAEPLNKLDQTEEELVAEKQKAAADLEAELAKLGQTSKFHKVEVPQETETEKRASEVTAEAPEIKPVPSEKLKTEETPVKEVDYVKPSFDLLSEYDNSEQYEQIKQKDDLAVTVMLSFFKSRNIPAAIAGYDIGASVSRFHITWPADYDVDLNSKQLRALQIQLGGKKTLRFIPVIDGCAYSGIEVENQVSMTVSFRSCFLQLMKADKNCEKPLLFPIGENLTGTVVTADLAKLPHLLVAGTTGSGKSVFVNSIIMSIIMRTYPQDVKLVLIDPKMVEFGKYDEIPHLLCPVILDSEKAIVALNKLVAEMERRFRLFSDSGCKDLDTYNNRHKKNRLPRIVVVIDEFADLMSTAKEASQPVARLAQKARAAGIHMILATQRPSVDVITGNIKNNIQARVALQVPGQVDSRTIIDEPGAENLCGHGDLLYKNGPTLVRCQSPFVSDSEIEEVADYLKDRADPCYDPEFLDLEGEEAVDEGAGFGKRDPLEWAKKEPLYEEVKAEVIKTGRSSVSFIKRIFGVSSQTANLFLDAMEEEGIVQTNSANGQRIVLKDPVEDDKGVN